MTEVVVVTVRRANRIVSPILLAWALVTIPLAFSDCGASTSWGIEQEISADVGVEEQSLPSIAASGSDVHVVWQDEGDGDSDIYYRHFDGTNWQPELEISTDVGMESQYYPSIAVDGSNVHVVWEDRGDGNYDIYYRHFDGTNWLPEEDISADIGTEAQMKPSIAVDGGEIHVVWTDRVDGDFDIYYRHFDGTNWQPKVEVSTDIETEWQTCPLVAIDGSKVHVVWMDQGDRDLALNFDIYYRYFDGTNWQDQIEIGSDAGRYTQRPSSIASSGSEVHIVWQNAGDGDFDIYHRHFDGMTWEPELEVSTDFETEWQTCPSIDVDGSKVHIAWEDRGDGDVDIHYRNYNGTNWLPEQEISTDAGTENQWEPSIAVDGGKAYVVWADRESGDPDIYFRGGTEGPSPFFTVSLEPASQMIIPGDRATYAVTVTSGNSYAGHVGLSITGLPSPATGVFNPSTVVVPADGSAISTLTIDDTDTLADDTYMLTITGEGLSGSVNAYLVVSSLGAIRGTVWDQDYHSVSDALVELLDNEDNVVEQTNTDIDGEYEFANIDPGYYIVRASKEGYKAERNAVTLSPGGTETIDLEITAVAVTYWWAILLIVIALIVLVGLAMLLKRRRPKAEPVSQSEYEEAPPSETTTETPPLDQSLRSIQPWAW